MNLLHSAELTSLAFPLTCLLAAALILLWDVTFRRTFHRGVLWGTLLSAAVLVGFWGATGSSPASTFIMLSGLQFNDSLAVCWLPASVVFLLSILNWPQAPGTFPEAKRREAWGGLLLVAAVQVVAISQNAWVQLGAISFSGWMLALVLGRETTDSERTRSAAGCLIWFTIADLLWLLGLASLGMVLPTTELHRIGDPTILNQLTAGGTALCDSALSLMVGSILLRCGMYPLLSWTAPAARNYRDAAWVIAFGFGPAMILLHRWFPLLLSFDATLLLLTGAGGLSAFILSLMAWGGARGPARMVHIASAQLGLIWLGLGANAAAAGERFSLTLCQIWLLTFITLGLGQLKGRHGSIRVASVILTACVVLLCVGILGQEETFSNVWNHAEMPPLSKSLLLAGAMFSQLLIAIVLFRETQLNEQSVDEPTLSVPSTGISAAGWLVWAMLTVVIVAGAILGPYWLNLSPSLSLVRPDVAGILMLIGLVVSRTWREPGYQAGPSGDRWESVRRLARSEFYVPGMINICLLLPIRAASQISRFLEWIVVGNLTMKIPSSILKWIGSRAALSDEETPELGRMWQLASATAVMLAGIAIGVLL
ncbi:hypothetical protein SH661x_004505 [Planctomicrobium sp. SH661]|uniref:hypothetical protein n=1 Tax=Planctomicrobium sp. SH661 TaxID=3448124 RepID=UPI003F5BB99F